MAEAFGALKAGAQGKPVVLVLGDMRELGESSSHWHRWVGVEAAALGPTLLVALGPHAQDILDGARRAGCAPKCCVLATSHEEAAHIVLKTWTPQQWILVKGSRGMTMERVVEQVVAVKGMKVSES